MSANQDCKAIEKGLKDIIFSMSSGIPVGSQEINSCQNMISKYSVNKQLIESEETAILEDVSSEESYLKSNASALMINQANSSKLIDLNALSEFTAKHIDSSFVSPITEIKLPHPDLEDDNLATNSTVSVLFEEIQKSPNFSNLPENPLQNSTLKHSEKQRNKRDEVKASPAHTRRGGKKKKKKKSNKSKDGDGELYEIHNDKTKTDKKILEKLKKEEITYIKTKKRVFPSIGREYSLCLEKENYRLLCHICNYNTEVKVNIAKHLLSSLHEKQKELTDKDMMIPFLPEPLPAQIEAITELITNEAVRKGLSKEDLDIRKAIGAKFTKFVEDNISICNVHLIGSSAYGIGLKSSGVDFVVKVADNEMVPDALEAIYYAISKNDAFENVIPDFQRKRPQIRFVDPNSKLTCNILIDNVSNLKLAELLSLYCKLDSRVQILGGALRYWAKLCDVDQEEKGTFPSFSLAILLVHFLQQVQPPVLPVIHEVKKFNATNEFYEKYLEENLWKSQNTDSIGLLWLKFFRFYTFDFTIGESVAGIRHSKRSTCADRNWSTKFYAIEEPFLKRNVAYVIPTFQVCQYLQNCFLRTYRYFAYPQMKIGYPAISLLKTDDFDALKLTEYVKNPILKEGDSDDSEVSENEDSATDLLNVCQELEDHDPHIAIDDLVATITNMTLEEEKSVLHESNNIETSTNEIATENKLSDETVKESKNKSSAKPSKQISLCFWDAKGRELSKDMFCYKLDTAFVKGDKDVPLICRICKNTGHLKKDCPVEEINPPPPLPKMTQEFLDSITQVLTDVWERNRVSEQRLIEIENEMRDIESSIKEVFPSAKLSLFGSFCNGFGFCNVSDLDFCLTFTDQEDGKALDSTEVINKVAAQLNEHPKLINVISITSAKVPIVKFAWRNNGLEGDISLYNTLALNNTEMLEVYSRIDKRVQVLGYALKYFAKVLGICDASRGSLSSYAYILMVLYFLQQRKPPVIPVLQELHDGEKPEIIIDGWNVWFYRDIDRLKDVWPDYGKNKESIAHLWLGLLSFYAHDFNWKEYVISIKQKKLLRRFRKLWISDEIAIEDPFDLNHNLGGGLSRKMNTYIIKTFIRGLIRFGTPVQSDKLNTNNRKEENYFFNRSYLNNGCEPPHDRGCGNCGKIGHIRKDCPQEKTCSYCRKPGHLVRNCPRKQKWSKDTNNSRKNNFNYDSPNREKKRTSEKSQNQCLPPPHPALKNDIARTYQGMHLQSTQMFDAKKLLQMGVPIHRLPPPPGFPQSGRSPSNPPPGFKSNSPLLQQTVPHSSPFPHIPPFPRQINKDLLSQSPPKHFSSSPPKNFQGGGFNRPIPTATVWPINTRHTSLQIERHPNPQYNQGNSRPDWPRHMLGENQQRQQKSNHYQGGNRRQNRTNSDHHLYNSNVADRWFGH